MLGCNANKALIAGVNPTVSAFLIALQARLWVPAVNIYDWSNEKLNSICIMKKALYDVFEE